MPAKMPLERQVVHCIHMSQSTSGCLRNQVAVFLVYFGN